ncbi:MAG: DUF1778 domain-containing protein [Gammaproteobacteria bacterium]
MGTKAVQPANAKTERLEARVRPEDKALIQRAADLSGRNLSEYVIVTAREAAIDAIRRYEGVALEDLRDKEAFAKALLNPPAPSRRLKAAAKRYLKSARRG